MTYEEEDNIVYGGMYYVGTTYTKPTNKTPYVTDQYPDTTRTTVYTEGDVSIANMSIQDIMAWERYINEEPNAFDDYQGEAAKFAIYPTLGHPIVYPALGLAGEAGEVAEKVKKLMRDSGGVVTEEFKKSLTKELGDVLWYISEIAAGIGIKLSEVADANIDKLNDRAERNVINGSGDNR